MSDNILRMIDQIIIQLANNEKYDDLINDLSYLHNDILYKADKQYILNVIGELQYTYSYLDIDFLELYTLVQNEYIGLTELKELYMNEGLI